jgi:hypothetical protein
MKGTWSVGRWMIVPLLVVAAGLSFFFFSRLGGDGSRIAAMCGG